MQLTCFTPAVAAKEMSMQRAATLVLSACNKQSAPILLPKDYQQRPHLGELIQQSQAHSTCPSPCHTSKRTPISLNIKTATSRTLRPQTKRNCCLGAMPPKANDRSSHKHRPKHYSLQAMEMTDEPNTKVANSASEEQRFRYFSVPTNTPYIYRC